MNWHGFQTLLKKYREGKASEEEILLIEQWYQTLGKNKPAVGDTPDFDTAQKRMWENIRESKEQYSTVQQHIPLYRRAAFRMAVAASAAAIILAITLWYLPAKNNTPQIASADLQGENIRKIVNSSDSILNIMLDDGSQIELEPNAVVSYPVPFGAVERAVHLEGNAYFSVKRNPQVPFNVYSGTLITQVLGTSFYIRADQSKKVEVSVRTGKVSVYESSKNELSQRTGRNTNHSGVVITPNQKVTYYPELHHFITSLVEKPEALEIKEAKADADFFKFEDAPLSNVLQRLEKSYNISFIVENEMLNHCPFTGDIHLQDLYSKLDLICQSIGIDYEVKGTSILLKGKGCY